MNVQHLPPHHQKGKLVKLRTVDVLLCPASIFPTPFFFYFLLQQVARKKMKMASGFFVYVHVFATSYRGEPPILYLLSM